MEIFIARIERGVAGDQRAEVRPVLPARDEAGALGVGPHIVTGGREGVTGALVFAHDMVVRLGLEAVWREEFTLVLAEKFGGDALIGCGIETQPHEMQVVGHENVGRAGEVVSGAGVGE